MSFFSLFTEEQKKWRLKASCLDSDNSIFFPVDEEGRTSFSSSNYPKINEAVSLCDSCPVSSECLLEAMQNDYYGIWAGTSQSFRNYVLRNYFDNDPDSIDLEHVSSLLDFVRSQTIKFRFQRSYTF